MLVISFVTENIIMYKPERLLNILVSLKTEINRSEQYIIDNGIEAETTNNMLLTRYEPLHEIIDV